MTTLLYSLIPVALLVFITWIVCFIKALKDPDVRTSSELRMSIFRFRLYRRLYDEYDEVLKQYGAWSNKADEYFSKIIYPQIKDMNEWRRYQDYRYAKSRAESQEYWNRMLHQYNKHANQEPAGTES